MKSEILEGVKTIFMLTACPETNSYFSLPTTPRLCCEISPEEAVKKYLSSQKKIKGYKFLHAYTVGCQGNPNHIWDYQDFEIYKPINPELPSLVMLIYKMRYFEKMMKL
jgi:hypothetical protein